MPTPLKKEQHNFTTCGTKRRREDTLALTESVASHALATLPELSPPASGRSHSAGELSPVPTRRDAFSPVAQDDAGSNPFILERTHATTAFHSPIVRTGVRVAELTDASPAQGYGEVKKTPGGRKVHAVYRNGAGTLFKPVTPVGRDGMVDTEHARREEIEGALPMLDFSRCNEITFKATLANLHARRGKGRGVGQNALMKARCREVFIAHGTLGEILIQGNGYHWSHLIAHFLGGEQSKLNLIPGTAASNYNTLEVVEQFIAKKLLTKMVLSIDINVEPTYRGESLIPDELAFELTWEESSRRYFETIRINPRSYQRFTRSMHSAIALLREEAVSTPAFKI